MSRYLISFLLLLLWHSTVSLAGEHTIEVSDTWIREAPPGTTVLAAFMRIHNHTAQAVTITAVSSPHFARIEMHHSQMAGSMAQMRQQPQFVIEPHTTLLLSPGSDHLMLFTPATPLHAGDQVPLTLHTAQHGTLSLQIAVRKATPEDLSPQPHHHH